jgi:hypothetical protein
MTELKPPYWEHTTTSQNRSCWIFHGTDQRPAAGPDHLLWWITKYDDGVWRVEMDDYSYPGVLMSATELAVLAQGLAMLAHGDSPTGVWLT